MFDSIFMMLAFRCVPHWLHCIDRTQNYAGNCHSDVITDFSIFLKQFGKGMQQQYSSITETQGHFGDF